LQITARFANIAPKSITYLQIRRYAHRPDFASIIRNASAFTTGLVVPVEAPMEAKNLAIPSPDADLQFIVYPVLLLRHNVLLFLIKG
jgi:hypothetical protein